MEFTRAKYAFPAQPGFAHPAAHLRAEIGRDLVSKVQIVLLYSPSGIRIEDDKIGVGSGGQRAFAAVESGKLCRRGGHPLADSANLDAALMHAGPYRRQRKAKARDAAPREVPPSLLVPLHRRQA